MKKFSLVMVFVSVAFLNAFELNTLIEAPTAGILAKGESEITANLYKNNGLVVGTKVGLFPRFMFGVNYGAENVVGNKNPTWHKRVEFNAKLRFLDESVKTPALAIGYDSQGHGNYNEDGKRYDIKSKGVFLVGSKNYELLGNIGFHLGFNYSLENQNNDDEMNIFAGFDKTLGDMLVLTAEYDTAWNDNQDIDLDEYVNKKGRGYLNSSLDIHFTENLVLKISFFDLLQNREDTEGCDRTLTLLYYMTF